MKTFISLIKQNSLDFIDALEKRQFTSPNNKHLHQGMLDLVEAGDYDGVVEFLKEEDFYKNHQLHGVCLVFTYDDIDVKIALLNAYDNMLEER